MNRLSEKVWEIRRARIRQTIDWTLRRNGLTPALIRALDRTGVWAQLGYACPADYLTAELRMTAAQAAPYVAAKTEQNEGA